MSDDLPSVFSYLREDHPRSSSEVPALPEILAKHTIVIAHLKAQLDTLQNEYDLAAKSHNERQSLLAPIPRLPSDILSEITIKSGNSSPLHAHEALQLSHVSHSWRLVALSTAVLCQEILLGPKTPIDFITSRVALTPSLFPLRVTLVQFDKPAMDFLSKFSTRCQAIDFEEDVDFSDLKGANFPMLQELTISTDVSEKPFSPFEHVTSLRKVVVRSNSIYTSVKFRLPWADLTSLEMPIASTGLWFSLLEACVCLAYFKVDVRGPGIRPTHSLYLPKLRHLCITFTSGILQNPLAYITAPGLEQLELSASGDVWTTIELITRCSLTLRRLVLDIWVLRDMERSIVERIGPLPHLEDFTCNFSGRRTPLIEFFRPQHLKELRRLEVTGELLFGLVPSIVAFIGHRWSPVVAGQQSPFYLSRLRLILQHGIDKYNARVQLEPLRVFRDAGFGIEVIFQTWNQVLEIEEGIVYDWRGSV